MHEAAKTKGLTPLIEESSSGRRKSKKTDAGNPRFRSLTKQEDTATNAAQARGRTMCTWVSGRESVDNEKEWKNGLQNKGVMANRRRRKKLLSPVNEGGARTSTNFFEPLQN